MGPATAGPGRGHRRRGLDAAVAAVEPATIATVEPATIATVEPTPVPTAETATVSPVGKPSVDSLHRLDPSR